MENFSGKKLRKLHYDSRPITLLTLALLLSSCNAFTLSSILGGSGGNGGTKEGKVVDVAPVSLIRGIPDTQAEKYKPTGGLPFMCDNGAVELPLESINDQYCDCSDGTDEPGTSACSLTEFPFICVNAGYKMISIPTSRIDDSICDCCDGSDEGNVKVCPNTCAQIADAERAELERITKEFKAGYAIREKYIKEIDDKSISASSILPELENKVETLSQELEKLRSTKELYEEAESAQRKVMIQEVIEKALRPVGAHDIEDISSAILYLRCVMDVLALTADDLHDVSAGRPITAKNTEEVRHETDEDMGEDDEAEDSTAYDEEFAGRADYDDEAPFYDDYEEDYRANEEYTEGDKNGVDDAEEVDQDSEAPEVAESRTTCALGDHSSDLRLEALCNDKDVEGCSGSVCLYSVSLNKIKLFLSRIVLDRYESKVLHLLTGYYRINKTFDGFDQFADELEALVGNLEELTTCPDSFSSNPEVCTIGDELSKLPSEYEAAKAFEGPEIANIRNKYQEVESSVKNSKKELETKNSYLQEVEKYKDYKGFLALKDQCVDVKDGKYTYSLCMLKNVHQNDGGGSNVSLGQFKSLSQNEDGTYEMTFEKGQHCHAHGPRTASVHITCGSTTLLSDATEASTCVYTFQLVSPAACSSRYGQLNGIQI